MQRRSGSLQANLCRAQQRDLKTIAPLSHRPIVLTDTIDCPTVGFLHYHPNANDQPMLLSRWGLVRCRERLKTGVSSGTHRPRSASPPAPASLCSPAGLFPRAARRRRRWRSPSNWCHSLCRPARRRYSGRAMKRWTVRGHTCHWWVRTTFHRHVMLTCPQRQTTTLHDNHRSRNCPQLKPLHRATPHTVNSFLLSSCTLPPPKMHMV